MPSIAFLAWRIASFSYGIFALLFFTLLILKDGSLWRRTTDKEKNQLAIATDKLWNLSKAPGGLTHAFFRLRNGLRLHYVSSSPPAFSNSANLIIFIHGFPDSWASWQSLVSSHSLRAKSRLVALDLPGYGGSDSLKEYKATEVMEAVTEFVAGIREMYVPEAGYSAHSGVGPGKVIIVAHDWGCTIAFRLASETPHLADRFILSNSMHPPLALSNTHRILSSSYKMLTTALHHPLSPSSRTLSLTALCTLLPLLTQLSLSSYIFLFLLPAPLSTTFGTLGNYWFLRFTHRLASRSRTPLDTATAATAMASSLGPGVAECSTGTSIREESYPLSVRQRAERGGPWADQISYYRDGAATQPWTKSLETVATLHDLDGSPATAAVAGGVVQPQGRRSSGGLALFPSGPQGAVRAPTTVVWGQEDRALDMRICLEGMGEFLLARGDDGGGGGGGSHGKSQGGSQGGSQVLVLPSVGHWVPVEEKGKAVLKEIMGWTVDGEREKLSERLGRVYPGAVRVLVEQ
ncbi:MAG: hypothetical protein M1827_004809 [Pycnora praestabilis]|nr:MAG: hypothetical protein M1827_004809 [Pycnora praestabilis]